MQSAPHGVNRAGLRWVVKYHAGVATLPRDRAISVPWNPHDLVAHRANKLGFRLEPAASDRWVTLRHETAPCINALILIRAFAQVTCRSISQEC